MAEKKGTSLVGKVVEVGGKEYKVIDETKSVLKCEDSKGVTKNILKKAKAFKSLKIIGDAEAHEAKETKKPTKEEKEVEKKSSPKAEVKPVAKEIDPDEWDKESGKLLLEAEAEGQDSPDFLYESYRHVEFWVYSIQRATKAQRVEYIKAKLKKEGKNSPFGLMLSSYKRGNKINLDRAKLIDMVLVDRVQEGKRVKKLNVAKIMEELDKLKGRSRSKIKREEYERLIHLVPDDGIDGFQGWAFYMISGEFYRDIGLKLTTKELEAFDLY